MLCSHVDVFELKHVQADITDSDHEQCFRLGVNDKHRED